MVEPSFSQTKASMYFSRPMVKFEERNEDAKLTIDGCRSQGKNLYSKVACFLMNWVDDDMGTNGEVEQLQEIFGTTFGYLTHSFKIPSQNSQKIATKEISDFVWAHDSPDSLIILYYGGHGEARDNSLIITACETGNDPSMDFEKIMLLLKKVKSDVLLILDCCFAGKAFTDQPLGRGKFEVLASSSANGYSYPPKEKGSFTRIMINTLPSLLADGPFSASTLLRKIYHNSHLQDDVRPMYFEQSLFEDEFDDGRIWLRPKQDNSLLASPPRPISLDVKLKLNLDKNDKNMIGKAMNRLATRLRSLPHVDSVQFQQLHAGDEDIKRFQDILQTASTVKEMIRRLKARVNARREKELRNNEDLPPTFYSVLRKQDSATENWTGNTAALSNGDRVTNFTSNGLSRRNSELLHSPHVQSWLLESDSISVAHNFRLSCMYATCALIHAASLVLLILINCVGCLVVLLHVPELHHKAGDTNS
ncbi:MAG: hypothetical protein M1834_004840 [Cirrosporium novae-zelandiae]|nr:MAG: hypothetical protein M1834_004840 [Cirrosporium novae-zelandiae]